MDFSSTPVSDLISYQLALSNAVEAIRGYERLLDCNLTSTIATLTKLNEKVEEALKDEQFEIDKLKEL